MAGFVNKIDGDGTAQECLGRMGHLHFDKLSRKHLRHSSGGQAEFQQYVTLARRFHSCHPQVVNIFFHVS